MKKSLLLIIVVISQLMVFGQNHLSGIFVFKVSIPVYKAKSIAILKILDDETVSSFNINVE